MFINFQEHHLLLHLLLLLSFYLRYYYFDFIRDSTCMALVLYTCLYFLIIYYLFIYLLLRISQVDIKRKWKSAQSGTQYSDGTAHINVVTHFCY